MNRKIIITLLALLLPSMAALAYDFSAVAPSGQTLYYSYTSGGVEVTYPATVIQPVNGWEGYTKPTGSVIVPATVDYGGTYYNVVAIHGFAFYNCSGLTSVTIPEGVTSVGSSAFFGCTMLSQMTLPSTLASIIGAAFYNCSSLSLIACSAIVPPSAGGSAFTGVPTSTCILQVPCDGASAYASTVPWSAFDSISSMGCTADITVAVNHTERGSVTGGGTYDVGATATLTALPNEGYFFTCWSDGVEANPRSIVVGSDATFTAWFYALQYDTVQVHDTLTLHDTVTMVVIHEDTTILHDTNWVNLIVWDTVFYHDTTTIHDTVLPTFFRLQVGASAGGVGIGNAVLPAGTNAEIGALPLEGYRFTAWGDGNTDNPRHVTVTGNVSYTAEFEVVTGIENVAAAWNLSVDGRTMTVECNAGATVHVFSTDGRQLMQHTAHDGRLRVWMPAAGVYLVQVDQMPARKVVINK